MTRCSILIMSDGARYLPSLRYSSSIYNAMVRVLRITIGKTGLGSNLHQKLDWVLILGSTEPLTL